VVLVLEELTTLTGNNIVFPRDLGTVVTLTLQNVSFAPLLHLITEAANLEIKKEPDFIRLSKKPISAENLRIGWEEQLLSLNAANVGIRELARQLTVETGCSVVTDTDLNANVTVFFQKLSLEEGLRVLCQTNNLSLLKEGDQLFRITRGDSGFSLKYQDGLLSIEAKNIEVSRILDDIARQARVNILYDREVRGAVTIKFTDLPLETGLRAILENNNFLLEQRTGSYYVHRSTIAANSKIYYDPESKRFDLELQNAPLPQVLADLTKKAEQNMIILNNVNYTISHLAVKGVTLEEAFNLLLKGTPYTFISKDDVYLFGDGSRECRFDHRGTLSLSIHQCRIHL
jgi:type II secretory pathway component HofQ